MQYITHWAAWHRKWSYLHHQHLECDARVPVDVGYLSHKVYMSLKSDNLDWEVWNCSSIDNLCGYHFMFNTCIISVLEGYIMSSCWSRTTNFIKICFWLRKIAWCYQGISWKLTIIKRNWCNLMIDFFNIFLRNIFLWTIIRKMQNIKVIFGIHSFFRYDCHLNVSFWFNFFTFWFKSNVIEKDTINRLCC